MAAWLRPTLMSSKPLAANGFTSTDDAAISALLFNESLPQKVRETIFSLKLEAMSARSEAQKAVSRSEVLQAKGETLEAKAKLDIMTLQGAVQGLMDTTAALNPRTVLKFIEFNHMPPEYKSLSRTEKWENFLSKTKDGIGLFECLKQIPGWDSAKKIASNFANIYSLASQHAHSTSSTIAANPDKPIRITGPLLPQTLKAMQCIGKTFTLTFEEDF